MQAKNNSTPGRRTKRFMPLGCLFHSFFGLLNLAFVFLLIVSAYSDRVSPEKNVLFAYLGLVFPFLLFANICFLIYWLVTKRWWMTCLLIVAFTLCRKPILTYCPIHPKTNILPANDLIKVLSYNVMSFAYTNHTSASPNKIIRRIAESDADIVCLQEYMVSTRANLMDSEDIAKALPMYPYMAEIFFSSPGNRSYRYGLAILSKYPITASRRIPFPSTYNGASIHTINVHGKKVTVVNNHLESFKLTMEDRSKYSQMITQMRPELLDDLQDVFRQKLGQAYRTRARQAEIVAGEIRKANAYYTIVCGDFNDTPISYAHRTIQGPLADACTESGLGMGVTYNQNYFYFRIDHIFHSAGMKAYNCRVDRSEKLSDHYPIHCYLKME
jgi:endonuclease/exonuclease/phosphatase family metal-dependent hydrolase